MDSLTQIVLGAACGEAVLGRKIGNKALLFGAIGGTIPDLDVLVGNLFYNNKIDAMLFHRGFMHSIFFSVLASFLLGWLIYKLYNTGKRLNTVVDPIYTLPFLVCLIVLMFFNRKSTIRRRWLKWGIGLSSIYMVLTLANKLYIDTVFKKSLKENNISYTRYSAQPAIFNNILWYGIAETDNYYFVANYSLFDTKNRFLNFRKVPKQRDLNPEDFQDIKSLAWFSDGYYSIYNMGNDEYQYNDLRYPLLDEDDVNSSVFSLLIFKDKNRLDMKPFEPKFDDFKAVMLKLWKRIKGI